MLDKGNDDKIDLEKIKECLQNKYKRTKKPRHYNYKKGNFKRRGNDGKSEDLDDKDNKREERAFVGYSKTFKGRCHKCGEI